MRMRKRMQVDALITGAIRPYEPYGQYGVIKPKRVQTTCFKLSYVSRNIPNIDGSIPAQL